MPSTFIYQNPITVTLLKPSASPKLIQVNHLATSHQVCLLQFLQLILLKILSLYHNMYQVRSHPDFQVLSTSYQNNLKSPSAVPLVDPSDHTSSVLSYVTSGNPSRSPSVVPSGFPSHNHSTLTSSVPSSSPSRDPSQATNNKPSKLPSEIT